MHRASESHLQEQRLGACGRRSSLDPRSLFEDELTLRSPAANDHSLFQLADELDDYGCGDDYSHTDYGNTLEWLDDEADDDDALESAPLRPVFTREGRAKKPS
jgi:hypothetical protein